ncbi:GxxExxY protein [Verrucomicrobia bacterium S94]|nr:GxxExxY protein [Verrucomicrobia bacterium S94]
MSIIFEKEGYQINGACFEVYKEKGCGFLEDVYQECLEIEFELQDIPFEARHPLTLDYKGRSLKKKYIPDFVCYGNIIVEVKAVQQIANEHRAQVQNYLKATGYKLGLIVNFGHYPKVQIERIAN